MNVRSVLAAAIVLAMVGAVVWWSVGPHPERVDVAPTETESSADTVEASGAAASPLFDGLDPEKEKFIWDAEHFTFELETHVGKRIAAGIRDRDAEAVAACLASEFQGRIIDHQSARQFHQSGLTESVAVADAGGETTQTSNGAEFANWLTSRPGPDEDIQAARFRVLQIARADKAAVGALPEADLWQLKTLLTQKSKRPDGSLQILEQNATLLCRFATDEDIRRGDVILEWTVDSESLRAGPPLMQEVTEAAGLIRSDIHDNWTKPNEPRQYNKQMAVADFDRDGFADVAIATIDRQVFLLRNEQGVFSNVAVKYGLPEQLQASSMLVTWIDFNNDGYPDLLAGDTLFKNQAGQSFLAISQLDVGFNPMGSAVADYDCDGLVDLYVLHQYPTDNPPATKSSWLNDDQGGAPNQLWRNLGDGRFVEMTGRAGVAGGRRHSFAAVWFHANEDHYPDLYVANDFARNSFFLNRGDGTFEDVSESSNTADFATSMGVAAGDLDGDGRNEIYVANMYSKMGRRILAQVSDEDYPPGTYAQLKGACAGNRLYRRLSDSLTYDEASDDLGINAVGWAYAPAMTDFDMDGRLDLYATAGFLSFRRDKPDG